MKERMIRSAAVAAVCAALMLVSESALALRCGNKLVRDGMHEQQVIAICGEPTTVRHLGYAVRGYDLGHYRGRRSYRYPYVRHLSREVAITEYVYNFGPRRLMRRLIFEGGILVDIESIGYGYLEKKR